MYILHVLVLFQNNFIKLNIINFVHLNQIIFYRKHTCRNSISLPSFIICVRFCLPKNKNNILQSEILQQFLIKQDKNHRKI